MDCDPNTALINSVKANYNANKSDAASVTCRYSNFKALGSKKFPTDILLTMSTKRCATPTRCRSVCNSTLWTPTTNGKQKQRFHRNTSR